MDLWLEASSHSSLPGSSIGILTVDPPKKTNLYSTVKGDLHGQFAL